VADGEGEAAEPRPHDHHSPALEALVRRLATGRYRAVLDLGASIGANIDFLARHCSRIHVVNLLSSLQELPSESRSDPAVAFAELLPEGEAQFDAVLAWDVLDYLTRDQVSVLVAELARLTRPGARMLALIAAGPEMPSSSGEYRIRDGHRLEYSERASTTRPTPALTAGELDHLLRGFRVERSFILRHGVHEYLAVREGEIVD
jgi:predicted TPR repeat methyltransferase